MISEHLRAGFPALIVLTNEYKRAEQLLPCDDNIKFMTWDVISGVKDTRTNKIIDESMIDPVEAVKLLNQSRDTVLICHNLHLFLDSPELIQAIQNGTTSLWKGLGNCLVAISPVVNLPTELEKIFTLIDLELPSVNEIHDIQCELGDSVSVKPNKKASRACKGLIVDEVEECFSLSLVRNGYFSSKVVNEIKSGMIKKSGLMEVWQPEDINNVGGLQNLKDFIKSRQKGLVNDNPQLPRLKSIMLTGISGCGKSLCCKAVAGLLDYPLVRLDVSSLRGSLVGQSEAQTRKALKIIDAFSDCVLWLDEVDKVFANVKNSGETDGGTSAGMFQTFLTWMQETKSNALVMATANNINQLPPEFIRRFTVTFFVDTPVYSERIEILKILNRKYNTSVPLSYADKTSNFTGSELESLVVNSLYDGVETAFESIIPLSITMKEEIERMRSWARTRARRANSDDTPIKESRKIRQIK